MLDGDRVAIVLLSAMGDVVHAFPLVSSLVAAAPHARIEWVVRRAVRGERFDLAIDLQVYGKASLATLILDARRKLGFGYDVRILGGDGSRERGRAVEVARAAGCPIGDERTDDLDRLVVGRRFADLVVDAWHDPGEAWHPPRATRRTGRMDRIASERVAEKAELARRRYRRAVDGPPAEPAPSPV